MNNFIKVLKVFYIVLFVVCFDSFIMTTLLRADMLMNFEESVQSETGGYFKAHGDFQISFEVDELGAAKTNSCQKSVVSSNNYVVTYIANANAKVLIPQAYGANRCSFYIKIPADYPLAADANLHFGTYTRHPIDGSPYQNGSHYYHYLNIPGSIHWSKVICNQHPQHQVGVSVDPGVNPTSPSWNYYDGFTRFYFEAKPIETSPVSLPANWYADEIQFYTITEPENDITVNSIICTYMGSGRFIIGWHGSSQYSTGNCDDHDYEVRYSENPITNSNYLSATIVGNSPFSQYPGSYNYWQADFTVPIVTGTVYFAIKDLDYSSPYVSKIDYPIDGSSGANNTPHADAGSDQVIIDNDNNGAELVTLDASASSDSDGDIVSYIWQKNGVEIAQDETALVELDVGVHNITLIVIDNEGLQDADQTQISVQCGDVDGPVISLVESCSPSSSSVAIKWNTDEVSNSRVEYGLDTNYGFTTSDADTSLVTKHGLVLSGLNAETVYHYRVMSKDNNDNIAISGDNTFETLPAVSQDAAIVIEAEDGVISSPMQVLTDDSASKGKCISTPQGTGNTSNPADEATFNVDIKEDGIYYIWLLMQGPTGENDALYVGVNGSFDRVYPTQMGVYEWVRVEDINNSANYSHNLISGTNMIAIAHGEEMARADTILITSSQSTPEQLMDTTPPSDVVDVSGLENNGELTLSWTNPSDADFAGTMVRYDPSLYPTDHTQGSLLCNKPALPGSSDSFTGTLEDGVYHLSIFTYDQSGNYSHTVHLIVKIDSTPPVGSVVINGGAAETENTLVNLTLSASDLGNGVTQMQFSNDGENWSAPEAYSTSKSWTLVNSMGSKTVYVKFKDGVDNWSGSFTDTINLADVDTAAPKSPSGVTVNLN